VSGDVGVGDAAVVPAVGVGVAVSTGLVLAGSLGGVVGHGVMLGVGGALVDGGTAVGDGDRVPDADATGVGDDVALAGAPAVPSGGPGFAGGTADRWVGSDVPGGRTGTVRPGTPRA
jgi:hypothetical protein